MSVYNLAPSPSIGIGENPFATWENGFTEEQIDRIRELGVLGSDEVIESNEGGNLGNILA